MKSVVRKAVKECNECQRHKAERASPLGLLEPLPMPTQVWSEISMDFIKDLLLSQVKTTIMVVDDNLSKFAHFLLPKHLLTAPQVTEDLLQRGGKVIFPKFYSQ